MASDMTDPQLPVAIVGMAVLLPGASGLDAYWQNLVRGVDAITDVPETRWDTDYYRPGSAHEPAVAHQVYCRRGGFVDDLAEVEVTRFGIMPNSVPGTEPDQLIALNVAAAALTDAGGPERLPDRHRVGVVLGRGGYLTPGLVRLDQRVRTATQLVRTLAELLPDVDPGQLDQIREAFTERLGPDSPESAIGLVPNLAASRIASRLDLRGPAYTVDAACASSLVAVDQAVRELAGGRCDVMFAGGVHHCHDITLWSVFSQLRALSPSQRIRPFHRDADGILIGEGTGVVVLKRLADAERDGDRVYAVIRGTGVASDGRAAGLVNPDPGGQAHAVRQAWRAAGLDPAVPGSIGLLEAHGTATPAGDTAELATLLDVFGPAVTQGRDRAVIGSVKSMIGHTMPAAGVAGLVKAALAVHHGTLLPTLHCDDPHPALTATRFRPLDRAAPWERTDAQPVRRAAVNAFGFGGINAHVVLEEAPGAGATRPSRTAAPLPATARTVAVAEPERVLLLAADTPERLTALLDGDDHVVLARGLDAGRGHPDAGRSRLAVVAPTAKRLALARRAVAKGRAWHGRGDVWFRPGPLLGRGAEGTGNGGPVFVFPGLEGDFEPHVDDVAAHFGLPRVAARSGGHDRVADVGRHGFDVVGVGRLLDAALRAMGVVPGAVAGHSVGEWTAMTVAGLYAGGEVDDFMASFDPDTVTVPGLAYGAIGASAEQVLHALDDGWADAGLVLSHDNAPAQSMVCGPDAAVREFVRSFRARGVLSQVLPFRSGFHTPMLASHLAPIEEAASRFRLCPPAVAVWSGSTAAPFPEEEGAVRELFLRHLLEPVRFRQLAEAMYAAGHRVFVQVGTGQLGSLIGDTLGGRDHLVVAANSPRRTGLAQLRRVAAALWTAGAAVAPCLPPARTAPAGRPPVRLDLGGALVSLDAGPLAELRARLHTTGTRRPAPLEALAARSPIAAELDALLHDTADTAAALLTAASHRRPPPRHATPTPAHRQPQATASAHRQAPAPTPVLAQPSRSGHDPDPAQSRAPAVVRGADSGPSRGRTQADAASVIGIPSAPTPGPGPTSADVPGPAPAVRTSRGVLRVSVEAMPHLLDHCFFPQRAGWPEVGDRWPVVPATTIVQLLMDTAQRAAPGLRAVAVHGARFDQWLAATPPVDVPVTVTEDAGGPHRLAVSCGPYARAVVELAPAYPAPPAVHRRTDPATERVPEHLAAQLYDERWMFHGPAFQGITELTAIGEHHIRGVITTPPAPGALLDNVGQLLGYWIMSTRAERTVVFPVGMRHMRFHGPHPLPGTEVECLVRVTSLTDTLLQADALLTVDGEMWAEVSGWQDRRFDNDPSTRPVERFPDRNTLSRARPGGWVLLHERWPDLASRELVMRNSLSGEERAEYAAHPPRGRRQWLLGRIAAKDAVRRWLWDHGEGPVYPAEIRIRNDASGRPYATGLHGRTLPPLDLSLAHRAEAGVAIVRPRTPGGLGPGIDVEEIAERDPAVLAVSLGADELRLLRAARAATGESEALWFTRFWAAKEAAAKAEGTGFQGRPKDFAVVDAADANRLVVSGPRHPAHHVRCERTGNPPGLPGRDYVVAWTTDPADEEENDR
ncbi:beta-ketoacyl synthase N-terminal-like domain-containing protein [Streptomyces sp. NPDC048664]|uniref:type I polyketide synthase n=1 Tax=Streptomyces sp. NPDC048664 TaxID=3154505 RepID=UPI00343638FF